MLFEQHLLDYNLQIQMAIMRLRYAAQQLMDLGIRLDDYENEKKIARGDLDRLQNSLRDVDTLKREYRNLQRLKYNYGLASSDRFTNGGLFGRQGEKLDIEEHNKGSRIDEDKKQQDDYIGRQEKNRNSASDLSVFGLIDEYYDQTHGI